MPQPPLTDRELRVLRGMIDEYEATVARRRLLHGWLWDVRGVTMFLGAVVLLVLQVVTIVLALHTGHAP